MTETFEPTIIGFTCNWCSYRAADMAGTARMKYPPNVRLIRLMCSGPPGSDLRVQGAGQRRGRRDDHRLPSRRMPLHRPELQGAAPLPSDAAHAARVGRGAGPPAPGLGIGRGGRPVCERGRLLRGGDPGARPAALGHSAEARRAANAGERPRSPSFRRLPA